MNFYLDLDGTLIDVSHRHYAVYSKIAHALAFPHLDFGHYWSLKRAGTPLAQILKKSGAIKNIEGFRAMWLSLIEKDDYLDKDTVLPRTAVVLKTFRLKHNLILVTLRHSQPALARQLERLKLTSIFHKIISAAASGGGAEFKASLIRQHQQVSGGWMVGDTEADVMAAKALGLVSCAVTSGLRSAKFLRALKPDYIIESIAGLPAIDKFAALTNPGP